MKEVSIIGVDLAKQVFQLHGATAEGEVVFRTTPVPEFVPRNSRDSRGLAGTLLDIPQHRSRHRT